MIHPNEVDQPVPDDSVRPGGVCCKVNAWPQGSFWPFIGRRPLVLTEYPDAGGQAIYFLVPNEKASILADDELVDPSLGGHAKPPIDSHLKTAHSSV